MCEYGVYPGKPAVSTDATLARQPVRAAVGTRLIALENDRIAGTVQYNCHAGHLHIIGLAVHPEYWRHGVARRLIEHIIRLVPDMEYDTIVLEMIRETGNVSVFQKLGVYVFEGKVTVDFVSDTHETLHEVKIRRRICRLAGGGDD